jgi:tetratricopeptide (TPR) repeat protein
MTNQVRVFLSSTFLDFVRERELVHTEVAPTLEEMCRHYGLSFELSDLRWGVTDRDVKQNRTVAICLKEVDLCRHVSPELNFLLLLGDRAGSRFIPEQVSARALETLLSDLARIYPQDTQASTLAERLRKLFPIRGLTHAGALLRDDSQSSQVIAEKVLKDPATAQSLISFSCDDPHAESLRISLAFSITHQEILRSGAIASQDCNEGAIAIIRTLGQPEELQDKMRAAVSSSFRSRVEEITAAVTEQGRMDSSYENDFVRRCTKLLGICIQEARGRGSKSHHFLQMLSRQQGLPLDSKSSRRRALGVLQSWVYSDVGPRVAAIVGETGSGRTTALRRAKSMIQRLEPNSRIAHLEVKATSELQALRNLVIALIAWASSPPLSETEIGELLSAFVPDLISRATRELARVESANQLFVLIDDLDLVVDESGRVAFSWLWSGALSRKALFTCGTSFARELSENTDIELIQLDDLSDAELLVVTKDACEERGAPWLDMRSLAIAARALPTPGYIHALIDAALHVTPGEWEPWASGNHESFFNHFLEYLQDSSPFSRSICGLFLGLSASTEHGVAEREFLSVCYDSKEVLREVIEHFPVSPLAGKVPPLVWHRLTSHFKPAIEFVGRSGAIACRVRGQFSHAVTESVGSAFLRNCRERLAEHFLGVLSNPKERAALLLPGLLTSVERDQVLAQLVLAQPFMKVSVSIDQAETLVRSIANSPAHNQILTEILRGSFAPNERSAEEQSHWLLDLSVLTRKLGHYDEAAGLATRAFEIRRSHLGSSHHLTVAAVLEATDCYLEAGKYARAERMCKATLQAADQHHHIAPALLRVKGNLASALSYQKRYDEAEVLLRELQSAYENDGNEKRQLNNIYTGLAICFAARGAFDEASQYATKGVAFASELFGHNSVNTAVALVNLASVLLKAGRPGESVSAVERALQIYSEVRDDNHPRVLNAAIMYFSALSQNSRVPDAVDFLSGRLGRITHFDDCAVWLPIVIDAVLQIVDANDAARFRSLLSPMHRLAAASPDEAWTGSLSARAAKKSAGALGLEDEATAKGFLVSGIFIWILAVLAATLRNLISRDEADAHLRALEDRLASIFGVPTPYLALQDKMKLAWQTFAEEYTLRVDCERLLAELRPPLPISGLLEAFDAQGARSPSIDEMKRRADTLGKSTEADSDERGQALILLAARAASAGQYDEAIAAQSEAAAIASNLFGSSSMQYAIATINLAALFFRASRYAEAFEHYRAGTLRALRGGAQIEALGGSVMNMATAGFEAGKFSETGRAFSACAEFVSTSPAAINVWLISASALTRAGELTDALDGFERAMAVHAHLSPQEGEAWLSPILAFAGTLGRRLGHSEKVRLRSMIQGYTETAEAKGWSEFLRQLQEWRELQDILSL